MAVLVSYIVYIVACLVMGAKLLLLWRRTREWPELFISLAFLLGGALSYCAWLAMGIAAMGGAEPARLKQIVTFGLASVVIGTLCSGTGTLLIFRAQSRAAKRVGGLYAVALGALFVTYAGDASAAATKTFWWTMVAVVPAYAWGAIESISLSRVLSKRVRIGLADPFAVNRMAMWGWSSAAVVVTVAISISGQLAYGNAPPQWVGLAASGTLLFGAGSIWLGFFPPAFHRARVARLAGDV